MKLIKAGVNTTRVHWLVQELLALGIHEITVIEHFKPLSQISRMTFVCDDYKVHEVKRIIHKLGTCGNVPDHYLFVEDLEILQYNKNLFFINT